MYNLPSAYDLLLHPPTAVTWKSLVKKAVFEYWTSKLKQEMENMSTIKFLNSEKLKLVVLHESLRGDSNQHDVSRTTIATKLLV
jgi:hypothetical protein